MLQLIFDKNTILVYDVDVWAVLRNKYRIIGQIIGNTSFIPALPLQLLPEEALLLLDKGIASVNIVTNVDNDNGEKYLKFENMLLEEEIKIYKQMRKEQLQKVSDKIIEKKRLVGDTRSVDEIINEEVNKSSTITKENMIWPILSKGLNNCTTTPVETEIISKLSTSCKRNVYKDLWERKYYITSGEKFGGDFLVYLGDPVIYHAVFIVRCIEANETITPSEIIAFGRLGTAVKKSAVLATFKEGKVSYLTVNWIDA